MQDKRNIKNLIHYRNTQKHSEAMPEEEKQTNICVKKDFVYIVTRYFHLYTTYRLVTNKNFFLVVTLHI